MIRIYQIMVSASCVLVLLLVAGSCKERSSSRDIDRQPNQTEREPVSPPRAESGSSRVQIGADISNEPLLPGAGRIVHAIHVNGMTCSGCANSITEAVELLSGVDAVRISLADGAVWVRVDETENNTTVETICHAIESAGYTTASSTTTTFTSGGAPSDSPERARQDSDDG